MDLAQCRQQIDAVDAQLIDLFRQRMELCLSVARYKKENNLPIFHPDREEAVIARASERGDPFREETAALYRSIMVISKQLQEKALAEK